MNRARIAYIEQGMQNDMSSSAGFDPIMILVLYGIWAVIAIAFYVWYLWSLSRLFPRIDLPSSHGWIPVWNQWQLVARAGLPGWLVLFALVPGLGIVAFVVLIIAMNRINNEYGKGAGFTVLGALLGPVWAMLLANHIDQTGHGVVRRSTANPQAYAPPGYAQNQQYPQGQQYAQQQPYVQAPAGGYQQPAASQAPQQAAPQQMQSNTEALFGAPAPRHDLPPVPPQAPPAQPAADSGAVRITPAAPWETPAQPAPSMFQAQQQAEQAAQQQAQQAQQGSSWGFSNTTEDAFERLAAQGAGPRAETPLGYVEPPRPFSWPEQQAPVEQAPSEQAPVAQAPVEQASAVQAPVESAPAEQVPAEPAPAPEAAVADHAVPGQFVHEEPESEHTETVSSTAPAAPAEVEAAAVQAPAASAPEDDDDDRTVVVPRRKRWGLELPSGDIEELFGDDVVIGRRPESDEGVTLLKIADPTRTLSKSHVRMRRTGDDWTIEDLQSTNGVSVDTGAGAEVIEAGREVPATDHMVIGTLEVTLREVK
ncbi:DUF5684 domain-containing protein [Leucobacter sp. GX0328]